MAALDEVVTALLVELGAHAPPEPQELDSQELRPADPAEVADSLAFAMRFDERGKARRTGVDTSLRSPPSSWSSACWRAASC
jgi:hypothetical protein